MPVGNKNANRRLKSNPLPRFSGRATDDAKSRLSMFEKYANFDNWNDAEKCLMIRTYTHRYKFMLRLLPFIEWYVLSQNPRHMLAAVSSRLDKMDSQQREMQANVRSSDYRSNGEGNDGTRHRRRCRLCGKGNHDENDCWHKSKVANKGPICYSCRGFGHVQKWCPSNNHNRKSTDQKKGKSGSAPSLK